MSKPPELRRLLREDLNEKDSNWIDKLISPINMFFEQVYSSFSTLTIGDNITGAITTISFKTPANYSTGGFNEVLVPWNKTVAAQVIFIGKINNKNRNIITNAVSITDWTQLTQQNIRINYISGLANSSIYEMTVLIL